MVIDSTTCTDGTTQLRELLGESKKRSQGHSQGSSSDVYIIFSCYLEQRHQSTVAPLVVAQHDSLLLYLIPEISLFAALANRPQDELEEHAYRP